MCILPSLNCYFVAWSVKDNRAVSILTIGKPPDVPERCIPLHFDNTPSDSSKLAVLRILPVVWETFKAYSEEFMDYIQARAA